MSQRNGTSNRDLSEQFIEVLTSVAKTLLWVSIGATVISVAFLVFTCFATSTNSAIDKQALSNVEILSKVLIAGVMGLAVSTTYLLWGEQTLGIIQIVFAAILYTAPLYIPSMTGNTAPTGAASAALGSLQTGGIILGVIGIVVVVADVAIRTRDRATRGAKTDQLKYGKGIKEESDRQNVFLGKCWQLPYCRKFVRERCPIYHSKRTCWAEQVGCMCEEEVIRSAMENRPIPKDALLAAKMIPRNNRLTFDQKRERCKSCVIYNEHQRHKYRALLPGIIMFYAAIYAIARTPLLAVTEGVVQHTSQVINGFTYREGNKPLGGVGIFSEILLVICFILVLSYSLKVLEYLIFKLKI